MSTPTSNSTANSRDPLDPFMADFSCDEDDPVDPEEVTMPCADSADSADSSRIAVLTSRPLKIPRTRMRDQWKARVSGFPLMHQSFPYSVYWIFDAPHKMDDFEAFLAIKRGLQVNH